MKKITPYRILVFMIVVLFSLSIIMMAFSYFFPKGIPITDAFSIRFPSFVEMFEKGDIEYANIDDVLNHKLDSTLLKELHSLDDSLRAFREISLSNPSRIHYPRANKRILHSFFEALENVEVNQGSLRIMHYGDSQIEMDRITGYIREELQTRFGGSGPGLQPPVQIISSTSINQSSGGSWHRYACWGMDNGLRANHKRYGLMLNMAEYTDQANITFTLSSQSYERAKQINRVRVLIGNLESTASLSLSAHGKTYPTKQVSPDKLLHIAEWQLDTFPKTLSLQFSGGGTPEVYGIALDGQTGVSLDNLPMRGCSGTIFTRADSALLKESFEALNVKLLILQFGGNMMPSIKGTKNAEEYGKRFYEQIMYLKSLKKDLSILVIGLADMSKRIDGQMQSYPFIKDVRENLKNATFDADGAYWDMFEVMGGLNSMPSWVNQGLAGKDYIHFTNKGAQKVAELFYEALINDYNEYRIEKRINAINDIKIASD